MASCDQRAWNLAQRLIEEFKGDKAMWLHEMGKVFGVTDYKPDLEALWRKASSKYVHEVGKRAAENRVSVSPVSDKAPDHVPAPPVQSVLSGRTPEDIDALAKDVKLWRDQGREGPLNPEAKERHDVGQVERVLGVSRKSRMRKSRLLEGIISSVSAEHDMGVFKHAWRVSMAAARRAVGGAESMREVYAQRLLHDIHDDPNGGKSAMDKVLDGEAIVVLRDWIARYTEDTKRAQDELVRVNDRVKELRREIETAKAAGREVDRNTAVEYGRRLKALQELAEVAEKGVNMPGDLRPQEVREVLERLERGAHKDTVLYVERIRAFLDDAADGLVERGRLSEISRRRHYFPHKMIEGFMLGRHGQGSGLPTKAKSSQFRGYTQISRSNRRLVDTNVTDTVLDYLVEVERHNRLDDWYDREVRRYAVPMRGKKAVPIEGEFKESERVAIREGRWEQDGHDRTVAWFSRIPVAVREFIGARQGVLYTPSLREMRETVRAYADSGGYVDVSASWGTLKWGMAEQSPEVRALIEGLRDAGMPLPALPQVGGKRFGAGRGVIRIPKLIADKVMHLRDNPSIYPAERWINRLTSAFKRTATVQFGMFSYYMRNLLGDVIVAARDDSGPQRAAAGSIFRWVPTARKIGRYKQLHDELKSPALPDSRRIKITGEASRLESELRQIDPRIPEWVDKAFTYSAIGSGFTAEDAATGRKRTASLPGLGRFSGLSGEGSARQAMDNLAPIRGLRLFGDWLAKVNERREDTLRTAKFVRDMVSGLNARQAVVLNHQTFIDYGSLTEFERRWLSRAFVPFWTWTKSNAVAWARAAQARPGRTAAMLGISVGLTGLWNLLMHEDEEERLWTNPFTRHIAQKPHLILPFADALGNPMVMVFDDPLSDALGLLSGDEAVGVALKIANGESVPKALLDWVAGAPMRGAKELAARTNPFVKTFFEAASGRDYFTDRRLWSESEGGMARLAKIAARTLESTHRGAAEVSRGLDRGERSGWATALLRSPISPVSPFVRAPDISSSLTVAEKSNRDRLQQELLSGGYATPGDRAGEINMKQGASALPYVKERTTELRRIDARARARALVQYVKAGDLEAASKVLGDKTAFRSLLALLPYDERVAIRDALRQHGTSLDEIARHAEFAAAKRR